MSPTTGRMRASTFCEPSALRTTATASYLGPSAVGVTAPVVSIAASKVAVAVPTSPAGTARSTTFTAALPVSATTSPTNASSDAPSVVPGCRRAIAKEVTSTELLKALTSTATVLTKVTNSARFTLA